jgi:hypothetical protein
MEADEGADKKRQCIDGRAIEQPTEDTYADEDGKCGHGGWLHFLDKNDVRLPPPLAARVKCNRSQTPSESKSQVGRFFAMAR